MRFALLCLCVFIQAAYAHQQNNGMLRRNNFAERSRKQNGSEMRELAIVMKILFFFRTFCCFCIWLMQRIIISAVCFRIQALCLGVFACCIRVCVVCVSATHSLTFIWFRHYFFFGRENFTMYFTEQR